MPKRRPAKPLDSCGLFYWSQDVPDDGGVPDFTVFGLGTWRRSVRKAQRADAQTRGGARTSLCGWGPSMVCPVSSWTHPRDRCKLRCSRLMVTSYGRCTSCATRTSCATWRGLETRTVPNERASVDSSRSNTQRCLNTWFTCTPGASTTSAKLALRSDVNCAISAFHGPIVSTHTQVRRPFEPCANFMLHVVDPREAES